MGKVSDLPPELLRYLLEMLSPEDRKMAVLVDRRWRKVGEHPILWKWCIITINIGDDINKLSVGRFKYVEEIYVDPEVQWKNSQLKELFRSTLEMPKLKKIGSEELDLRCVDSELLGKALGKLEIVWLIGSDCTTNEQRFAILNEISKNDCIKDLRIRCIDLKTLELEAGILGNIVSTVQSLCLDVSLTSDQALEIFKSISENNQINTITLDLNLSSVDSELFGRAMAKIDSVIFDQMEISPSQARALFTEMGRNGGIKKFYAIAVNFSSVNPKVIAKGLSKLEEIQLASNILTDEQVQAIFAELKQNCNLKFLDLGNNNLSSVDAGDLAAVINNINVVDVSGTQLGTEQITAILTLTQRNTKLTKLDITGNRISEVDPAILETAGGIIKEFYVDSEDDEDDEDESLDEVSASENDEDESENDT